MMHLVDTTLFFSPTSGGVRRYLLAKHAWWGSRTAHRHSLVVPGPHTRLAPGGESTVAAPRLPGTFNYRLPLWPPAWSAALEALQPDLIEVGDAFQPAWCALRVARRRHVPTVAFFHSNLAEVLGRRFGSVVERAMSRYCRSIYARFDLVLAPSRLMCRYLEGLGLRRVVHQPLGVDTQVFSPERRTLDLRAQLALPADTRLLLYAGRFSEEKNLPVLQRAVERLGRLYHLVLLGGDRSERSAPQVTRVPYRREAGELAAWIASADAFVHAGPSETFGLVAIEAMACGRPVIGVRSGAVPELVDERVGELAEPDDERSFAEAMVRLYERGLEPLGLAARRRAVERFTWDHVLQLQLGLYESLIAGRYLADPPSDAVVGMGSGHWSG